MLSILWSNYYIVFLLNFNLISKKLSMIKNAPDIYQNIKVLKSRAVFNYNHFINIDINYFGFILTFEICG